MSPTTPTSPSHHLTAYPTAQTGEERSNPPPMTSLHRPRTTAALLHKAEAAQSVDANTG
jgi:hypothetical protein